MRSTLIDLRPLKASAAWRRLWVSWGIAGIGGLVGDVAVLYYVWQVTGSSALVGTLALARAIPTIVMAVVGGSYADRVDRRRLVIGMTLGQFALTGAMAVQILAGFDVIWLLIVLVMLRAGCGAVAAPARKTFTPNLLPAHLLPAGFALNHIAFQVAMLAGPAIGGVLTGAVGPGLCLLIDAATFLAALYGVVGLPPMPPQGEPDGERGWRAAVAGLTFIGRTPTIKAALLLDLSAMVLAMPIALFPVINEERFGGGAQTLGLFLTAMAVGGVVASVLSGRATASPRPGRIMLGSAAVWGVGIAVFGLSGNVAVSLAALVLAGAGDTLSVVSRSAMVQLETPDRLRGRVSAVEFIVGASSPDLGNFRAGVVGSLIGAPLALVTGGLSCVVATGLIGWLLPAVRRYQLPAETQETAADGQETAADGSKSPQRPPEPAS